MFNSKTDSSLWVLRQSRRHVWCELAITAAARQPPARHTDVFHFQSLRRLIHKLSHSENLTSSARWYSNSSKTWCPCCRSLKRLRRLVLTFTTLSVRAAHAGTAQTFKARLEVFVIHTIHTTCVFFSKSQLCRPDLCLQGHSVLLLSWGGAVYLLICQRKEIIFVMESADSGIFIKFQK